MRRFAVKPTFRGWALYFFRGNEQVAYASGEQTVYLEGARAYSFSRLFSVPAFLILLIFWPTEAAGAWKRRYVVLRIALVLLASVVSYVLVCRGRLPGLTKGGETRRLNAVAPPLCNGENYRRLLFCRRPILRGVDAQEEAVFTTNRPKWWCSIGFILLEEIRILLWLTYILQPQFPVPGRYMFGLAWLTEAVAVLLSLLGKQILLRCFPRYWSRVCTAQQGEDVGCDADDPGIFI